jgi:hypothetical protein
MNSRVSTLLASLKLPVPVPVGLVSALVALVGALIYQLPTPETSASVMTIDLRVVAFLVVPNVLTFIVVFWLIFRKEDAEHEEATKVVQEVSSPRKSELKCSFPRGLKAEVLELPQDFLHSLITWEADGGSTPSASSAKLDQCIRQRSLMGIRKFPTCQADGVGPESVTPDDKLETDLAGLRLSCAACEKWSGNFADFCTHLYEECPVVLRALAFRQYRLADQASAMNAMNIDPRVQNLFSEMLATSPVLVHRFPPEAFNNDEHYTTPPFCACGRSWCLVVGSVSRGVETRFFGLLPHGHSDRLRCVILFAKSNGKGFLEKRIDDWPLEKAGFPWGPVLQPEQLQELRQADNSLLVMVHAEELIKNSSARRDINHEF